MASYPAIAATSQGVLGLLESAAPGTEFAGTRFEHYGSADLNDPMSEGVSLWLYRVTINTKKLVGIPCLLPWKYWSVLCRCT